MNINLQDFFDTEARRAHAEYLSLLAAVQQHKQAGAKALESKRKAKKGKDAIRLADEARGCEFDRLLAARQALAHALDELLPAMAGALTKALTAATAEMDAAKAEAQSAFASIGAKPGVGASTERQQEAFNSLRFLKERRSAHNDIKHALVEQFESAGDALAKLLERL